MFRSRRCPTKTANRICVSHRNVAVPSIAAVATVASLATAGIVTTVRERNRLHCSKKTIQQLLNLVAVLSKEILHWKSTHLHNRTTSHTHINRTRTRTDRCTRKHTHAHVQTHTQTNIYTGIQMDTSTENTNPL